MFIRKNSLFVGVLLLCVVGAGCFILMTGAGKSKGKVEIKWLYPPKYYHVNAFSEGRAWVQEEDGLWSLLDDQGNVLKTGLKAHSVSEYEDGIAPFWTNLLTDNDDESSRSGLLNRSGDVVLPPGTCDGICGPYSEGLITREGKNGLWGFIDLSGKWVIPPLYDRVDDFEEGLTTVKKGDKWGFIDKKGTVVIDFKFDEAYGFFHKMAPVQVDSKWGVIDPKGRWIAEPIYDEIGGGRRYWSDLIALKKDGRVGFINSKGDVVIDFQYLPAGEKDGFPPMYYFDRGRAIVLLDYQYEKYRECGIIDESGRVLLQRKNCDFILMGDYILCQYMYGQKSLIDRENREYDLPRDVKFFNPWFRPDWKSSYPFMGRKDGKIGYFTISIKKGLRDTRNAPPYSHNVCLE